MGVCDCACVCSERQLADLERSLSESGPDAYSSSAIRAFEWALTPVGPMATWPTSLKTLVDICLGSSSPMFVVWGPARPLIYNSAYAEVLANKHPALGQDFLEVWHEIRADLEPLVARAYAGEATSM